MLKKIVASIAILLVGLAANIIIYNQTFTTPPSPLPSFAVCGNSDQNASDAPLPETTNIKVGVMAGEPIETNVSITVASQTCTGQYKAPTFHLSDFIGSWQFYINWLIWCLPLFCIAYLISRYAHIRH